LKLQLRRISDRRVLKLLRHWFEPGEMARRNDGDPKRVPAQRLFVNISSDIHRCATRQKACDGSEVRRIAGPFVDAHLTVQT
jgi:hypothetical protein